jgi:2-keto-4-pentenoate hydratase/2-oxohepta-3-ene-1,7-dioic acid hydratase in catechol pathway
MTLESADLIFTGNPAKGTGQNQGGDNLTLGIESDQMMEFRTD